MSDTHPSSLSSVMAASRTAFIAVAIFSFFFNAMLLIVPLYSMQIFDRVLSSRSTDTLMMLTAAAAGLLIVQALIDFVRSHILLRLGLKLETELGGPVLAATLFQAARAQSGTPQGLRDLAEVRQALTSPVIYSLFDAPWAPVFLAVLFLMHPSLGWLSLGGAIALAAIAVINLCLSSRPHARANAAAIASFEQVQDFVQNAQVIQAMGMLGDVVRHWRNRITDMLWLNAQVGRRQALLSAFAKFVRLLLQVAVMGLGVYLVLQNQLSPGSMIAASILMARALAPLEQAVAVWKTYVGALSAYRRLKGQLQQCQMPTVWVPLPPPQGQIRAEQLVFAPDPESRPVLRGLSFELNPGDAVGILGPSGSGKSTLAKLLVGALAPTAGDIRLDGADIARWDRQDMGRHFGYLPQSVQLFAGTVRDNIARMTDAPAEAVMEAAQRARVHDLIVRLPQGYDTRIGSGGVMLSGGQQQRIGLARALFGDPRIVVLDEPDSNLDPIGQEALHHALEYCRMEKKTVVVITHRAAILQFADRLLLLRDGHIERDGSRDEVMQSLFAPRPAAPTPALSRPDAPRALAHA